MKREIRFSNNRDHESEELIEPSLVSSFYTTEGIEMTE